MDFDSEDVVLENSPLYEHLKEIGYTDFEYCTKKIASNDSPEIKQCNNWNHLHTVLRRLFNALKNAGRRCFNAVCAIFLPDFHDLGCSTRKDIITFISNTKLLIEDDRIFLNGFSSDFMEKCGDNALSSFQKWKYDVITVGSPYILAGSVALFSWYVSSSSSFLRKSNVWNILDKLLLALVVAVIVGHSTKNFIYYHYKKNVRRSIKKLKELVEISANIGSLAKNCIRFIQESEIVARGFTLASLNVPVQRLELSSMPSTSATRQYPEFRENIFHWTRNAYYRYRQATVEIHKIIPLQPTLDVLSHYLASIQLDEFGPILKLSVSSEKEKQQLIEASDQFSLSSLKSIFQLMEVQRSEFFRLFTLGFVPDALIEIKQDSLSAVGILFELIPYVDQLVEADQKTHAFLIAANNYYRSLEISQLLTEREDSPKIIKQSPYTAMSLALHSLNLHLRSALKRVYKAELHLEKNSNTYCDRSLIIPRIDNELTSCLNEVRAEIEASRECLNETEQKLNSMMNPKLPGLNQGTVQTPEMKSSACLPLTQQSDQQVIPLFEIGEPVIQDQVFEAFTDKTETESNNSFYAPSDTKLKEHREASAHLLKELRSVLVSKALEYKAREEKALSMVESTAALLQHEQGSTLPSETEGQNEDISPMQEETSSDDSPQDNLTDKSIETLRESDEIERWELLSDKEIDPPSNDNETHLSRSSEKSKSIAVDSENNITEMSPNANLHPILEGMSFALGSSIAALAADRCKNLGMQMETFAAEGEECFGDDDDDDDDSS